MGRHSGMSLIEVGLVMLIVVLALVPVVHQIGGPNSNNGNGNVARVVGQKSKEIVLANTILEQALAADYSKFACNTTFNPQTGFPAAGQFALLPATRCEDTTYNQSLYYQWTVQNMDPTGQRIPVGNHYYTAVLNVWDTPAGGTPLLTLPTTFFWNENSGDPQSNRTGILVVQDTSGSMTGGSLEPTPVANGNLASPYLKYRFSDPAYGYIPAAGIDLGDIRANQNLDIVSLMDADDPDTDWQDRYLGPNVPGMSTDDCDTNPSNYNSAFWRSLWSFGSNNHRNIVRTLCSVNGAPGPAWSNTLSTNLSRIEAARSSLLSFLLSIEEDPELYQNIKLGFVTFSTGVTNRVVPLEGTDGNNQFPQMRRKLSWLNREGPGLIPASGNTNMYAALQRGADVLYADPSLDSRIIFFVGDGYPTIGSTSMASIRNLSSSIGDGTYPGAGGKKITVFSLGLLSQQVNPATGNRYLDDYLDTCMAAETPGGMYRFAQNVGDMKPIFEQIGYQIQRVVLLNKSNRYNIDLM